MCIRDSDDGHLAFITQRGDAAEKLAPVAECFDVALAVAGICLLYTSDAADERSSVDLGGRRIIKKKKSENTEGCRVDPKHKQTSHTYSKP